MSVCGAIIDAHTCISFLYAHIFLISIQITYYTQLSCNTITSRFFPFSSPQYILVLCDCRHYLLHNKCKKIRICELFHSCRKYKSLLSSFVSKKFLILLIKQTYFFSKNILSEKKVFKTKRTIHTF